VDAAELMTEPPARPRASFDCLWCGRSWTTRSRDDLEGWAQLCPDCLGRAGENPFLRFRLRDAIAARGAAGGRSDPDSEREAPATVPPDVLAAPRAEQMNAADDLVAYYEARAEEYDDWYLRRGRYARGPIHDAAWNAELDGAGTWLDSLPISGEIVELAAGTGWWSPLLASKGELSLYDAAEAPATACSPIGFEPTSTFAMPGQNPIARSTPSSRTSGSVMSAASRRASFSRSPAAG
jgi:hypothetical protein